MYIFAQMQRHYYTAFASLTLGLIKPYHLEETLVTRVDDISQLEMC